MCRGIRSTTLRNRADKLQGEDRNILSFDLAQEPIRPGITGPASLKYRDEEEILASLRLSPEGKSVTDWQGKVYDISKSFPLGGDLEEAAIWYNDGSTSLTTGAVIHPDKVRLNLYYYNHYSLTCGRACSCSAIGKQACHCSRVLAAFWKDGFD